MTREEAANILDPETTLETYTKISYYGGFKGESVWQDAVNEACRMGAAALRTQQDQCGLTNEQLGRLVANSYAEGYEDCKAGKPPLEKRTEYPLGEWISVKDRLPEPETEVFIRASCNCYAVLTTAMYEDGTISTEDSAWSWYDLDFDYDESRDVYLIPEGWWEYCHYNPDDVYNNAVDDTVTHWMPLPEPPKEESK